MLDDTFDDALAVMDETLLDANGRMKLFTAGTLKRLPLHPFRLWCAKRARYGIPTRELVDCVRVLIGGRSCIEVAAGMGDLGHHLGVKMTDAGVQQSVPGMEVLYKTIGQGRTAPPADVEILGAWPTVTKYRPQVVVASWVTQKFKNGDHLGEKTGSCVWGVDEDLLIDAVDMYILIGNDNPHGDRRIFKRPHTVIREDWIVSRAAEPDLNFIRVFTGRGRYSKGATEAERAALRPRGGP